MKPNRLLALGIAIFAAVGLTLAGPGFNEPVRIAGGTMHKGDVSSLNGSITVGDGATVEGDCESVNGGIRVGEDSRVESLSSVNGSIEVGRGSVIEDHVQAVNGRITLERDSRADEVSTVNGGITLIGADVEDDVSTINGDITLREGATVGGDIVIEKRGKGNYDHERTLKIELEGGSTVQGSVLVEDDTARVKVYLRDGSRVLGRIENAEVVED